MSDAEFLFYAEEALRRTGFTPPIIHHILQRYCEGRALHAGTEEDFTRPGFNNLTEAREEGFDKCIYQIRELYRILRVNRPNEQQRYIGILLDRALRLEAVAAGMLKEAIEIARTVETECDEKDVAISVTRADGRPVGSGMECYGDNGRR